MRPDQERVRNLLLDTVTLLCKNGLDYKKEMKVQGLIGITLDDDDVFLVHFDELSEIPSVAQDEELESEKHGTKRPGDVIDIDLSPAKRPHHAGPGGSTPRRLDLSNTLRQQVPETKPRIKQEVGDDVVILDNDEPEDQKPGLPIEGNIEMDSNQLAALTGFRDGGGGAPPGPGQMGMPGGQGWSPGRVGPPGMPPHGSNQDMLRFPHPRLGLAGTPPQHTRHAMFPGSYKRHRVTNPADRPYKCEFEGCQSSFSHLSNLRTHEVKKHARPVKYRRSAHADVNTYLEHMTSLGAYSGSPAWQAPVMPCLQAQVTKVELTENASRVSDMSGEGSHGSSSESLNGGVMEGGQGVAESRLDDLSPSINEPLSPGALAACTGNLV